VKDTYRRGASILLLRPLEAGGGYEFLLLHKPRKRDAWQLPQGGVEEGETIEQCALRELQEEAGIEGVALLGTSEREYTYDFPTSYRRFRPDHICGQQIAFVYGLTDRTTQVVVDEKEVNQYRWIRPEQLPRFVRRKEYLGLVQGLVQEALDALR